MPVFTGMMDLKVFTGTTLVFRMPIFTGMTDLRESR